MKLIMDHAKNTESAAIGLLLDQEKAYDRVHSFYLSRVLCHFGFPTSIVSCIKSLYFQTSLRINVSGFFSPAVPQKRGLRQGDPLSPVLFNLSFEPFLRRVLSDPLFLGFQLPASKSAPLALDHQIKLLAYADDVACFVESPAQLDILHRHLDTYSRASNARINYNKTESFALSGLSTVYQSWRTPLNRYNISSWNDSSTSEPIIYLGFPLCSNANQREPISPLCLPRFRLPVSYTNTAIFLYEAVLPWLIP
jgi:hypothetical protein